MPANRGPQLAIKLNGFYDALRQAGAESQTDRAHLLGCSAVTVWRVFNGDTPPSSAFVAAALAAFPAHRFDDLFKIHIAGGATAPRDTSSQKVAK